MTRRLDVKALIALVGEDVLRDELSQNTYTFLTLNYQHTRVGLVPEVYYSRTFHTDANPIEWLIFNDKTAFFSIYGAIEDRSNTDSVVSEEMGIDLADKDRLRDTVSRLGDDDDDGPDGAPETWCNALWDDVKELDCRILHRLLSTTWPAVMIFNSDHNLLLDYHSGETVGAIGLE